MQHLAISISAEQYAAAKEKFAAVGVDYLGPDRGVEESMYFRDPNGVGLELYREDLGVFDGRRAARLTARSARSASTGWAAAWPASAARAG